MRKTIDEILSSHEFFMDIQVRMRGIYMGKKIITGIPSPEGLREWFTLRDRNFPQQIYISGITIPQELRNNAILDVTGKLRVHDDGLFYFEATEAV